MHVIKWKKSDRVRLGKAVARFNRIAEKNGIEKVSFKDLSNDILTRKELNRQVDKLKGLTNENASGYMQAVQDKEIKLAQRTLRRMLKNADRGDFMVNPEYAIIKGEIRNIQNLEKLGPKFREKKLSRISLLARSDYEMKSANNYREEYLRGLRDRYSDFPGYDKLMDKLSKITNPKTFYERAKQNEETADIYYIRYSRTSQEFFNKILESWGLGEYGTEYDYDEVYG